MLIHASGHKPTEDELFDFKSVYVNISGGSIFDDFPDMPMERGGIIGKVDMVNCVKNSNSQWTAEGAYHFVLENPVVLPFKPVRGQRFFFDVNYEEL